MEVAADGYSSSSSVVVEEEEEEEGACFVYIYSRGSNYVFGSPLGRICRSIGSSFHRRPHPVRRRERRFNTV